MVSSRIIFVPLSAVAAASSFPIQSSGLPLLSGLDLMATCFESAVMILSNVTTYEENDWKF